MMTGARRLQRGFVAFGTNRFSGLMYIVSILRLCALFNGMQNGTKQAIPPFFNCNFHFFFTQDPHNTIPINAPDDTPCFKSFHSLKRSIAKILYVIPSQDRVFHNEQILIAMVTPQCAEIPFPTRVVLCTISKSAGR